MGACLKDNTSITLQQCQNQGSLERNDFTFIFKPSLMQKKYKYNALQHFQRKGSSTELTIFSALKKI